MILSVLVFIFPLLLSPSSTTAFLLPYQHHSTTRASTASTTCLWSSSSSSSSWQLSPSPPPPHAIPNHLAIILDGNGRWAQQRGLPRGAGHREGSKRSLEILQSCLSLGIKTLTLYCLSTENWSRPQHEVAIILECIETSLQSNLAYAHENRIRLVVMGQTTRLPPSLQALIQQAEAETAAYDGMTVCLALSYGGRDDIVQACRALAIDAVDGKVHPWEITEEVFAAHLQGNLKGVTDPPDLLIRTSGERRLSNFMLYQCAYSEIFVAEALWPDFKEEDLWLALRDYGQRARRFGGLQDRKGGESVGASSQSSLSSAAGFQQQHNQQ